MKKRLLPLVCIVLFCFAAFGPLGAQAASLLPDADAGLTLYYQQDGKGFADLPIQIYRVAQAYPDGNFMLIAPFYTYPINIQNITDQQQWRDIASTLNAYITADGLAPDREALTDENGTAAFAHLQTGLYFVREAVAEDHEGTYIFNQFMIYVPTPQPDGTYDYEVEARPKCTSFTPNTQYSVTKLWQDTGAQAARPVTVTVDIYKDGVLQETQILSAANNWSYAWTVAGNDTGRWTVAERDVSAPYKVTVQQNGNVFSIINTCETPPDIPDTGDSFAPLPWIIIMCIAGFLLLILGLYGRRRK